MDLKNLKKFHGHLGPFVVLGCKMGESAKKILKGGNRNLTAQAWIIMKPPVSCLLDGIQVASGCTIGRGNLKIVPAKSPKSIKIAFQKGKNRLEYKLRTINSLKIKKIINSKVEDLFLIRRIKNG